MKPPSRQSTKIRLVIAYLVISAASVRKIPFMEAGSADFQNIYAFQQCVRRKIVYLLSGETCGDVAGRDMVYPPLLFHSFAWVRKVSFPTAAYTWTAITIVTMAFVHFAWIKWIAPVRKRPLEVIVFCGLLVLQYPFIFLLERGGTDIVPLFLWTFTAFLFCRGRIRLAGAIGGVAAAFKLYPAISCAVIGVGLLVDGWKRKDAKRFDFLRFGGTAFAAFAVSNLIFFRDAVVYFTKSLPAFGSRLTTPCVYSHSLQSFSGDAHKNYWKLPILLLLALWMWSAGRAISKAPAFVFAGALAISTYFSATSWDYNLVTTFPLLVLSFIEARRSNRWLTLTVGLVAITFDRELFEANFMGMLNPSTHLALQFAWLTLVAVDLAQEGENTISDEGALAAGAP